MSQSASHAAHITGPKTYGAVLLGLLVLTVITVQASYIDFGSMNTVVALIIATIKASLVALFFMHLRHDKFNAVIFVGGLLFLSIFIIWTMFDLGTRETILPSNLKEPVLEFPGAPLNKPVRPSTGQPAGTPAP
ncbi:cytochrome C oxidase subunit IV family protein [Paludibaculum fermentans]|uniref:Cytochrome C oxidase subunit IV family protein n=1 Tax=Paludibaculum fermentans TaxID=1473598 RepID=A0A7S7NUD9_PALFE|nr:cytochrome C oxidase subunit IV family protein [Paludibaculum fermentans]QOY89906.1 cytochrome C oxidase subunit IV family protein [Paludibaculum fermentans]